jgi:hypothetical protein
MRASRKLTEPAVCQSVRTRISSSNNAERAVLWTYRFCRIFDGIPLQRWFWKGVLAPLTGTSLALIRQEFLPHQQHCSVSINTTPKSTEQISINRPYRQSRSEAINTHTSMVHHCREQQPKSSPPPSTHDFCSRGLNPQKPASQTHPISTTKPPD